MAGTLREASSCQWAMYLTYVYANATHSANRGQSRWQDHEIAGENSTQGKCNVGLLRFEMCFKVIYRAKWDVIVSSTFF